MEKKVFLLSFDYEDGMDKTIDQVFNADHDKILEALKLTEMNNVSYSSILMNVFENNNLSGNELMFLATIGLKTMIEENSMTIGVISLDNLDSLKKFILSLPEEQRNQIINKLPQEIRDKLDL